MKHKNHASVNCLIRYHVFIQLYMWLAHSFNGRPHWRSWRKRPTFRDHTSLYRVLSTPYHERNSNLQPLVEINFGCIGRNKPHRRQESIPQVVVVLIVYVDEILCLVSTVVYIYKFSSFIAPSVFSDVIQLSYDRNFSTRMQPIVINTTLWAIWSVLILFSRFPYMALLSIVIFRNDVIQS